VESGTATNLTLNTCTLWLNHKQYPKDEEEEEHKMYASLNCRRKVINVLNMQQTQTMSANIGITPIILSQVSETWTWLLYMLVSD
jgi:hypothetical protein